MGGIDFFFFSFFNFFTAVLGGIDSFYIYLGGTDFFSTYITVSKILFSSISYLQFRDQYTFLLYFIEIKFILRNILYCIKALNVKLANSTTQLE